MYKLERPLVVFDLESTGVKPVEDRVVSISAFKLKVDLSIDRKVSKLINPTIPIPAEATAVHGISNEMVENEKTFAAYAKSMYEFFSDCDIAGFNISDFDIILLSEEFSRCGIAWPQLNTKLIDAMKIFKFKEKRDLTAAAKFYLNVDFADDAHDAEKDARITVDIIKAQLEKYQDLAEMDIKSLDEFCIGKRVDIAGKLLFNADGHPVFAFGKHKGELVSNNYNYAKWMMGQADVPSHTKKIIRGIFNGRI